MFEKIKSMVKHIPEACGWLGMVFIQGATMPTTIGIIMGSNPKIPEISLVMMVWTGLFLYFVRAVAKNDRLHIVSNGVGFFLQSTLLALIVFGG